MNFARNIFMEVTNQLFYHLSSNQPYNVFPKLEVGQVLQVGQGHNTFYNYFFTQDFTIPITHKKTLEITKVAVTTYLENICSGVISKAPQQTVNSISRDAVARLYTMNRELFVENIRLRYFPHLPSRLSCLWLCNEIEQISKWMPKLGKDLTLVTLLATGHTHEVDSNLLPVSSEPFSIWEEKSRRYWSGEMSDNPLPETLFIGTIHIQDALLLPGQVLA